MSESSITVLQAEHLEPVNNFSLDTNIDVQEHLLADTRSNNTKRAYEKDLKDFFEYITEGKPNQYTVIDFLRLSQQTAVKVVLKYKSYLVNTKKLSEATVNRRLSAIKSLVMMGRKLEVCFYSLDDVKGEKVESYRDTSGIPATEYARVISLIDKTTFKGKRDYAILRLLWDNALRRGEVCSLNVGDFDAQAKTLRILGKGKGTQKVTIDLSLKTTEAITDWLIACGNMKELDAPLFTVVAYNGLGNRISGEAIRRLVDELCTCAGISKKMSPHRVRHSSITTVLDKNNGNYRATQRFSRHAKPDTVMKYDDNRQQLQKEMTDILADLI